jgi:hypothetical protein
MRASAEGVSLTGAGGELTEAIVRLATEGNVGAVSYRLVDGPLKVLKGSIAIPRRLWASLDVVRSAVMALRAEWRCEATRGEDVVKKRSRHVIDACIFGPPVC